jgi:Domain of unknown function (DUF5666)
MNEYDPTDPVETSPTPSASRTASGPSLAGSAGSAGAASPPSQTASRGESASGTMNKRPRRRKVRQLLLAAAVMSPVIGLSVGLAASPSASAAPAVSGSRPAGAPGAGGGGSNARSGPAAGGASGTVTSVSKSTFTMTTSAGQKVTVDETSSTKYQKQTSSTSKSAVKKGENVLVLGTVSSTTIKATQVIVQTSGGGSPASTAATVIPFQKGAPTTSKQVGKIPANYSEGSGTIVSGTTANKATEAALAAYPGGVVDRVVKLSNGEYEVHNIGVNWPHHIFVSQSFKVVGAE